MTLESIDLFAYHLETVVSLGVLGVAIMILRLFYTFSRKTLFGIADTLLTPATITSVSTKRRASLSLALSPRDSRRSSIYSPTIPMSSVTSTPISPPVVPTLPPRRGLYPEIQAYLQGRLQVSDVHNLYYEESGNPAGRPVVFVHGGPGGGTDAKMRRFFDPAAYRIILFDQRGCGQSKPHACLEDNTTWHLVEDMEKLREHLHVDRWMVFGGSWGSTLALAYAETYPDRVTELVLRGIFLLRKSEIQWFYQQGASWIFPDSWEPYWNHIPEEERGDMIAAYYKRLTSDDPKVRAEAARIWSVWEGSTSYLYQNTDALHRFAGDEFSLAFARIECHYFVNGGFFDTDSWLLENAHKIRHIPTTIVQGRYDCVCPMKSAWDLHRVFPEAELCVVPDAGHSSNEPGITSELVKATDKYRKL